jgi:hypothetical protein
MKKVYFCNIITNHYIKCLEIKKEMSHDEISRHMDNGRAIMNREIEMSSKKLETTSPIAPA